LEQRRLAPILIPEMGIRPLMKTVKTKLHHRKARTRSHPAIALADNAAEIWELDHDRPDPDMMAFSMERSPKQENL